MFLVLFEAIILKTKIETKELKSVHRIATNHLILNLVFTIHDFFKLLLFSTQFGVNFNYISFSIQPIEWTVYTLDLN